MKRVGILYRVSSAQQVDKVLNDIPMQKISCREFAKEHGWTIVIEKEEKGISGFKVSASKRDAIQALKEAALNHEIDVLLVFMFDRLGRIESETPFVLEWFINNGIEVWSVNEGQQCMETHVDKLMNYIRFWQASGESEKTSIRVKTRLKQMTNEGIFTGGVVPFGYALVEQGRMNKHGKPARDLVVQPEEAEMVKTIFSKAIHEGYGTHQLATYVNNQGFRTRNQSVFRASNIHRILKNELYCGFMVRGDARSDRIPALQIISDEDFFKVQNILKQRNGKNEEKRTVAMSNRSRELLSGNIFCAHCGCRLVGSRRVDKYVSVKGVEKKTEHGIYICYHRSRKLNDCDGATTYYASRVDQSILDIVQYIFAHMSGCPEEDRIKAACQQAMKTREAEKKRITQQLSKDNKQLELLQLEIGKALIGDSVYSSSDLSTAITVLRDRIDHCQQRLDELKSPDGSNSGGQDVLQSYKQFKTWAEEFENASFQTKKMIVNQLFSRIEIGRGYNIRLEMNCTYKQFCEEWMQTDIGLLGLGESLFQKAG